MVGDTIYLIHSSLSRFETTTTISGAFRTRAALGVIHVLCEKGDTGVGALAYGLKVAEAVLHGGLQVLVAGIQFCGCGAEHAAHGVVDLRNLCLQCHPLRGERVLRAGRGVGLLCFDGLRDLLLHLRWDQLLLAFRHRELYI